MSWCAVDVRSPGDFRDVVASWLVGRTGQAVEEREDGTLVGFSENEVAALELVKELHATFRSGVWGEARPLPEIDWSTAWRDGLGPRSIGRLTVTPSWAAHAAPDSPTVVIDPESAFGTGEHGSTRTALALLERHLRPGDRVIDLGSGSGILAIASVKLGASQAAGVEVDDEADPIAAANAAKNGVDSRVCFVTGDAALLAPLLGPVEIVISNILLPVNITLLPVIHSSLLPGGLAIFAGMEVPERELFLPALGDAGFDLLDEVVDDAWWGAAGRRADAACER
jgi:ribosomal protein L11 methyltransferase